MRGGVLSVNVGNAAGTIAAGDDARFGQWTGTSTGLVAGTARTSLGLGTAATTSAADYATAAQGAKADAALPTGGGTLTGTVNFPGAGIWNVAGKVGIGTASPAYQLHIVGTSDTYTTEVIKNAATGNAKWANFLLANDTTGTLELGLVGSAGYAAGAGGAYDGAYMMATGKTLNIGTTSANDLRILTNSVNGTSNERLRITSAGNIGIGTTTPQAALDVNGTIITKGLQGEAKTETSCTSPTGVIWTYTSAVNTGYTLAAVGSEGAEYMVHVITNPHPAGSGAYRATASGMLMVYNSWTGSDVNTYVNYVSLGAATNFGKTVDAALVTSGTEVTSASLGDPNTQIRIKISGYYNNTCGTSAQKVFLTRVL